MSTVDFRTLQGRIRHALQILLPSALSDEGAAPPVAFHQSGLGQLCQDSLSSGAPDRVSLLELGLSGKSSAQRKRTRLDLLLQFGTDT